MAEKGAVALITSHTQDNKSEVSALKHDYHGMQCTKNQFLGFVRDILDERVSKLDRDAKFAQLERSNIAGHIDVATLNWVAGSRPWHAELVKLLLNECEENASIFQAGENRVLHHATEVGDVETVANVIAIIKKQNIGNLTKFLNAINEEGFTVADIAVRTYSKNPQASQRLLAVLAENGADYFSQNEAGETALMRAMKRSDLAAVHALFAMDGRINISYTRRQETALHVACQCAARSETGWAMLELLATGKSCPDWTMRDSDGRTPLDYLQGDQFSEQQKVRLNQFLAQQKQQEAERIDFPDFREILNRLKRLEDVRSKLTDEKDQKTALSDWRKLQQEAKDFHDRQAVRRTKLSALCAESVENKTVVKEQKKLEQKMENFSAGFEQKRNPLSERSYRELLKKIRNGKESKSDLTKKDFFAFMEEFLNGGNDLYRLRHGKPKYSQEDLAALVFYPSLSLLLAEKNSSGHTVLTEAVEQYVKSDKEQAGVLIPWLIAQGARPADDNGSNGLVSLIRCLMYRGSGDSCDETGLKIIKLLLSSKIKKTKEEIDAINNMLCGAAIRGNRNVLIAFIESGWDLSNVVSSSESSFLGPSPHSSLLWMLASSTESLLYATYQSKWHIFIEPILVANTRRNGWQSTARLVNALPYRNCPCKNMLELCKTSDEKAALLIKYGAVLDGLSFMEKLQKRQKGIVLAMLAREDFVLPSLAEVLPLATSWDDPDVMQRLSRRYAQQERVIAEHDGLVNIQRKIREQEDAIDKMVKALPVETVLLKQVPNGFDNSGPLTSLPSAPAFNPDYLNKSELVPVLTNIMSFSSIG